MFRIFYFSSVFQKFLHCQRKICYTQKICTCNGNAMKADSHVASDRMKAIYTTCIYTEIVEEALNILTRKMDLTSGKFRRSLNKDFCQQVDRFVHEKQQYPSMVSLNTYQKIPPS